MSVKCRKCRQVLAKQPEVPLLTAHGEKIGVHGNVVECATLQESALLYLLEDELPAWITAIVNEGHWAKGRLHCITCGARVGGFDFVSGHRCACGSGIPPAVHLIKSKVDLRT